MNSIWELSGHHHGDSCPQTDFETIHPNKSYSVSLRHLNQPSSEFLGRLRSGPHLPKGVVLHHGARNETGALPSFDPATRREVGNDSGNDPIIPPSFPLRSQTVHSLNPSGLTLNELTQSLTTSLQDLKPTSIP